MRKKSYMTVTDQFCGAGGSSLGAAAAGAEIRLALNHWKLAIQTHNTNFPDTDHDCTDISAVDPRRYPPTDILITSPECVNHSLAKGRKRRTPDLFGKGLPDPSEERSRATMWDVPRFAEFHDYECIIVENVVDARKWVMFPAWLAAMHLLGYDHEVVYFNSMFAYPTPQSRDRMYVVFWKKGNTRPNLDYRPQAWCARCGKNVEAIQSWKTPRQKWGRYGRNRQYVYRCSACTEEIMPYYFCAINAIDWSQPSERIGDRKRPLKEKTMERIRIGLERYGRQGFVFCTSHAHSFYHRSITDAMPTQTTAQDVGMVIPLVVPLDYTGKVPRTATDPLPTQTSRQSIAFVVSMRDSPKYPLHAVTDPLPTQSTIGAPYLVELHGTSVAHQVTDPLGCILAGGGHHGLVTPPHPFIISYYGNGENVHKITDPVYTVTGTDRHALVSPFPVSVNYFDDIVRPVSEPMPTQTTAPKLGIATAEAQPPRVEDCYFRMLKSHEIGRAMAFPDTYVVLGNERERVKQYGNAVTPPAMTWIFNRCLQALSNPDPGRR